MSAKIFILRLSLVLFGTVSCGSVDLTMEAKGAGYDVSLAVVRKIYRSGIFVEDDYFLTHRVAQVATNFGLHPDTYDEERETRGIWQLSHTQFNLTLDNPALTRYTDAIPNTFPTVGNWSLVSWNDLLKPLVNGLAFRLYLQTFVDPFDPNITLPVLLPDQGSFYNAEFNSSLSATQFVQSVLDYEGQPKCNTEMDLVFIHDGSCTVYPENFTNTRTFMNSLVSSLSFPNIRVGSVVYNTGALVNFDLSNKFTEEELQSAILNSQKPGGAYTDTATGLSSALKIMEGVTEPRVGVAKAFVLFTDGGSTEYLDEVSDATLQANIQVFAVGLSVIDLYQGQLLTISHGKPGRVLKYRYTFGLLPDFLFKMQLELCSLAHELDVNGTSVAAGRAELGEHRYYKINIPEDLADDLIVTIVTLEGQVEAFYSSSEETPNSALHDGQLEIGEGGNRLPRSDSNVYISIQGQAVDTLFIISLSYPNH